MLAKPLCILFLTVTVILIAITLSSSNSNLYHVESALTEDNNQWNIQFTLIEWNIGYSQFKVPESKGLPTIPVLGSLDYSEGADLEKLCGLPGLCGSLSSLYLDCQNPCLTLASCGQAFMAILVLAMIFLLFSLVIIVLESSGKGIDALSKFSGILLWLGMFLNFISCMTFLGSIVSTASGHNNAEETDYFFFPGLPPTGLKPLNGAICQYTSLVTYAIAASLYRAATNDDGGKAPRLGGAASSPSFRFAAPTKSNTAKAKRPSSVKKHGAKPAPNLKKGSHHYV